MAPKKEPAATLVLNTYDESLGKLKSKDIYVGVAKTFFKRHYKTGDLVIDSLDQYKLTGVTNKKIQSMLGKFSEYLVKKKTKTIDNDIAKVRNRPMEEMIDNFLEYYDDHLKGEQSANLYKKILDLFASHHRYRFENINKQNALNFLEKHERTLRTKKLYKAVLKAFFTYIIELTNTPEKELNKKEKRLQDIAHLVSLRTCQEIIKIHQKPIDEKESVKATLSEQQRENLLRQTGSSENRALIALMAWNGLRLSEALKLTLADIDFEKRTIRVIDKGSARGSEKSIVYLLPVVHAELKSYLGKININPKQLIFTQNDQTFSKYINSILADMQIRKARDGRHTHTCESLRLTAGQLLYNDGTPLEWIQRTLRYKNLKEVFRFVERAEKAKYLEDMKKRYG